MAYPTKNLNQGESVALDMKPHWWYLSHPVIATGVMVVIAALYMMKRNDDSSTISTLLTWLVFGGLALAIVWLAARYVKWISTYFVVTNRRLIFKQGIVSKSGVEIPLERVNNVNFRQSAFERILGAGDLLIESGGTDGQQRFSDIRNPEAVQDLISDNIEAYRERRAGGTMAAPHTADVGEQLERLEGLLQRGSITQAEFDAQKAKLLA